MHDGRKAVVRRIGGAWSIALQCTLLAAASGAGQAHPSFRQRAHGPADRVSSMRYTSTRTDAHSLRMPAPAYDAQLLEGLGGNSCVSLAVNNKGIVVGAATDRGGIELPVYWEHGRPHRLSLPPGFASGYAKGVNDAGEMCGDVIRGQGRSRTSRAVVWRNGRVRVLGDWPVTLNTCSLGINAHGAVAFGIGTVQHLSPFRRIYVWERGLLRTLRLQKGHTAYIHQDHPFNDKGELVGMDSDWRPLSRLELWKSDGKELAVRLSSPASGACLNDHGDIVVSKYRGRIVLFTHGREINLNVVGLPCCVSNNREVVGEAVDSRREYAFLWTHGSPYYLDTLLTSPLPYPFFKAPAINDRGQIVAVARLGGIGTRNYLLSPTRGPEGKDTDLLSNPPSIH